MILIGAVLLWFILGYFAVRMYLYDDQRVTPGMYGLLFLGAVGYLIATIVVAGSGSQAWSKAHFLHSIPIPTPSEKLQAQFFGVKR